MKITKAALALTSALFSLSSLNAIAETITVDNESAHFAVIAGSWEESAVVVGYEGNYYQHDGDVASASEVQWQLNINHNAVYQVFAKWTTHANRASNASYIVEDAAGSHIVQVNQRQNNGEWVSLGELPCFDVIGVLARCPKKGSVLKSIC